MPTIPPDQADAGEPLDLALRDDLTGAWNRRYLRQFLNEEWTDLVAAEATVSLLVLDLDLFKEINDAYGHLAGDQALQKATGRLRASFRGEDRLIRYGGDEFVVALVGVGAEEARSLAERARSALRTVEVVASEGSSPVTLPLSFSMGVATYPADGATGEEILAVADRRLYEEKRARRPPAVSADRGRRRLLLASALAVVVLAVAGWVEWRRLRAVPPPPAAVQPAPIEEVSPLAEIVVRDEEELVHLRDEVRRLQAELAEPRPADDRRLYEGRIRELEARLEEAGDVRPASAPPVAELAPDAGGEGVNEASAGEGVGGMQIGERRTRENLTLEAPAPASPEVAPTADSVSTFPRVAVPAGAAGASSGVQPPQLLRAVRPDYPPVARARRRAATVELRIRVDAAGQVIAVEPVGPPAGFGFDESARAAALAARFRPGRRDGEPVEMEARLAIRFVLEGPPR